MTMLLPYAATDKVSCKQLSHNLLKQMPAVAQQQA